MRKLDKEYNIAWIWFGFEKEERAPVTCILSGVISMQMIIKFVKLTAHISFSFLSFRQAVKQINRR